MEEMYAILCRRSAGSIFGASEKYWSPRGLMTLFEKEGKAIDTAKRLNDLYGSKTVSYAAVAVRVLKK